MADITEKPALVSGDPEALLEELAQMVKVGDYGLIQLDKDYVAALRWIIGELAARRMADAH